jgi:hypothetical protein
MCNSKAVSSSSPDMEGNAVMAHESFRDLSDVRTAMKQFAQGTSQDKAKGSFAPLNSLTELGDAIAFLCQEVSQLRAEVDEMRTRHNRDGAASSSDGAVPRPKQLPKKKAKTTLRR